MLCEDINQRFEIGFALKRKNYWFAGTQNTRMEYCFIAEVLGNKVCSALLQLKERESE
jgi:hypothetical protein